ncbi:MAG: EF-hand domain-containing protein [Sulfurospirillaceae bacterium]|nr:EF-hand domain-containing protein [Sulfurospirillaceae bacterium]
MKTILSALVLTGLIATLSCAKDVTAKGPTSFKAYDKNKDGVISEEEFNAIRAQKMEARAQEGRPMRNAENSPVFGFFDTNKDGKITQQELVEGREKLFESRQSRSNKGNKNR